MSSIPGKRTSLVCLVLAFGLLRAGGSVIAAVCSSPQSPPFEGCSCSDDCAGNPFLGVLNEVCQFAHDLGGGCLQTCDCCRSEQTELFAGVNFEPTSPPAHWPGLGGRGERAGEAALCLLRDLGNVRGGDGIFNQTEAVDVPPLGEFQVTQRVALEDFNPATKTMHGFQSVSVCVPVFGCINDQVQKFTAELLSDNVDLPLHCGDYPFSTTWGLRMPTSDTEHRLRLEVPLPPIPTLFGPVSATPEFRYITALKAGFPGDPNCDERAVEELGICRLSPEICEAKEECTTGPSDDCQKCPPSAKLFAFPPAENGVGRSMADALDFLCGLLAPLDPPGITPKCPDAVAQGGKTGVGEISQLALGGRGVATDESINPGPNRPDLDLGIPRTADERIPVGFVSAKVPICYCPTDLIPSSFLGQDFDVVFKVCVTPEVKAGFASQFQVFFDDKRHLRRDFPVDLCPGPDETSRTRVFLKSQSRGDVKFSVTAGVDFVLKFTVNLPVIGDVTLTLVELHEKVPVADPPPAQPVAPGPTAEAHFPTLVHTDVPEQSFVKLTSFSSAPTPLADPNAFLNECFTSGPVVGQTPPTGSFDPGDPSKLTSVLEFPCNQCLPFGALTQGCGRANENDPLDYECHLDKNGQCCHTLDEATNTCADYTGCKLWPIPGDKLPPGTAGVVGVPFATPQIPGKEWLCDAPEKAGCMDLCTYDPTAAQPVKVVQSAVDLDPARCGGSSGGSGKPCPRGEHSRCDDGNPCTKDECEGQGEFGVCRYSPQDGPCDDSLFCTGADQCALGACALHAGNPCAAAGDCCDETSNGCVDSCPVPPPRCGNGLLQPGEECDDGNAVDGDGCSSACLQQAPPDHFKCYRTREIGFPRFESRSVTLTDAFTTETVVVRRPARLCNPADKNNEGINNPAVHLMCYDIEAGPFARRNVLVRNQFGDQTLAVVRPENLCVPAEKDGVPFDVDQNHFKCYRARARDFAPRPVTVIDQFETRPGTLQKPRFFCTPVDKEGEGIPDPATHLTCYKFAGGGGNFSPQEVTVTDQFAMQDVRAIRGSCRGADLLCVPSELNSDM